MSTIQNKGFIKSVKANIFNCASCQLPPILPQYTIHAARCLFIKPQSYSSVNKVHLEPSRVTLGRCTLYMVHPLFLLPVFFAMTIFFAGGQAQKILCPCPCTADLKWHTWMRHPRTDCSDITIIASGHWVVV